MNTLKHITTVLFLLWLCHMPFLAYGNTTHNDLAKEAQNNYLLKNTDGAFALSSCRRVITHKETQKNSCLTQAFIPESDKLLAQNLSEVHSSAAIIPVIGYRLLGTAAESWGKHLHWLPKNTLTKWVLSLAGGAIAVGYLVGKLNGTEDTEKGIFFSKNQEGNKEKNSSQNDSKEDLSSQDHNEEDMLLPPDPDPKPIAPIHNNHMDKDTLDVGENLLPLVWEQMSDDNFDAQLIEHNISLHDYQKAITKVEAFARKTLLISPTAKDDHSRDDLSGLFSKNRDYIKNVPQSVLDTYQYAFSASKFLLADYLKIIKHKLIFLFNDIELTRDGYALYTRPLVKHFATQMPRIINEACTSISNTSSNIDLPDCLELYSYIILEGIDPSQSSEEYAESKAKLYRIMEDIDLSSYDEFIDHKYRLKDILSGSEIDPSPTGEYLASKFRLKYSIDDYSLISSILFIHIRYHLLQIEEAYIDDVKQRFAAIDKLHSKAMKFYFDLPSYHHITRSSRTKILQDLVTNPSQYLKDHPQLAAFNDRVYTDTSLKKIFASEGFHKIHLEPHGSDRYLHLFDNILPFR
ncbi:MAG: hypothetical protein OXC44_00145 [Proteobacteria bacterium]|nr:hypothetical protein [Pseudomonadota bacterium]